MSRRTLTIIFETPACALVKGFGSREMLADLRRGRPPVWSRRERAWVAQPATARDLIAVAEARGYDVTITGAAHSVSAHVVAPVAVEEREPGLW